MEGIFFLAAALLLLGALVLPQTLTKKILFWLGLSLLAGAFVMLLLLNPPYEDLSGWQLVGLIATLVLVISMTCAGVASWTRNSWDKEGNFEKISKLILRVSTLIVLLSLIIVHV